MAYALTTVPGYTATRAGIQLGTQLAPDASEQEMAVARQLGVEWVMTSLPSSQTGPVRDPSIYRAIRDRFAEHGLSVYRIANHRCHNMESVTLGLPDRNERVAEYLQYIRDLGAAGIRYATYAHMANGIWSSDPETTRGGSPTRALRLDRNPTGRWIREEWHGPLTHGREYTEDELWENYTSFIREVAPVAEEASVRIGIHPDDPPVHPLGGIPRCIFGTFDGYRRAVDLADSPNVGVCLCVGCWLEGGEAMGADVLETIRWFGSRGRLFKVHLRNISAPLPEGFAETWLDDGCMEMGRVIRELHRVDFDGAVISDHLPETSAGRLVGEAFSLGYIRGLIDAVSTTER